jgi:hypothetical protein
MYEVFVFIGYYTALIGSLLLTSGESMVRNFIKYQPKCATPQNKEGLIYTAAEA